MLKQQQGYVLSKIGPHTYLLPYGQSIADQKHGIIINETGEFLWKMLETPQSMDTLITALAGHYQMDSSEISDLSEDVVQFIRQLISLGIVQDLSKASVHCRSAHFSNRCASSVSGSTFCLLCPGFICKFRHFYNPYTGRYDNRTPVPDSTVSSKWNGTSAQ